MKKYKVRRWEKGFVEVEYEVMAKSEEDVRNDEVEFIDGNIYYKIVDSALDDFGDWVDDSIEWKIKEID